MIFFLIFFSGGGANYWGARPPVPPYSYGPVKHCHSSTEKYQHFILTDFKTQDLGSSFNICLKKKAKQSLREFICKWHITNLSN